jgi:phosphoserine phosphatase
MSGQTHDVDDEIINEWTRAILPARVVMIGDGISDLETKPDIDVMVGFGGIISRDKVKAGSDIWVESFAESSVLSLLSE